MTGIYKITSPSKKVYIGQTIDWDRRKKQYKNLNCKLQKKLFSSFKKYGTENHIFEMVHELPSDVSQSILDHYEVFYSKKYIECKVNLLNLKIGGREGAIFTDETRRRMSESQKGKTGDKNSFYGRHHTESTKNNLKNIKIGKYFGKYGKNHHNFGKSTGRPVDRLTINGDFIERHTCSSEAGKLLKICVKCIQACCREEKNSAGGFKWRYSNE